MDEMQTIVTDVRAVSPPVCLSVGLFVCHVAQLRFTVRELFGAVFAKSLWSLDGWQWRPPYGIVPAFN